jgi:hypothetical protein
MGGISFMEGMKEGRKKGRKGRRKEKLEPPRTS